MSEDNVVVLPVVTRLDLPPDRILKGALEADLKRCFVVGWKQDGELYFASSFADGGDVLWLWEKAKALLLEAE
jgi:hypothetical protein